MSNSTSGNVIVVGIDGSSGAKTALDVAADEASRLAKPLKIVHAHSYPSIYVAPTLVPDVSVENDLRAQAEELLREAGQRATDRHPHLLVTTELVLDASAPALLAASEEASVLVLGSRGLGGFKGLVLGSVTVHVSAHATCPVLVVPTDSSTIRGPVVVGIDGSDASNHALQRAYVHAHDRDAKLVVIHAWNAPQAVVPWDPAGIGYDAEEVEQAKELLLSETLAGWQDTYPDVAVESRVVRDHPAQALLDAAGPESLIVVGSRGRGGFRGLLLGSVSQSILHNAPCPVEIVH